MAHDDGGAQETAIGSMDVFLGARLVRDKAKELLEDAVALYGEGRHGSAAALAILVSEESLKGIELSRYFRKRTSVTKDAWDRLKNHDYKLTGTYEWTLEQLRSREFGEFHKKLEKERGKRRIHGVVITPQMLIAMAEDSKRLHRHMQPAKEACMYQNWNRLGKKWDTLSPHEEKSLAYYVIENAHTNFGMFLCSLDSALDTFIRENPKLSGIKEPHPAVPELPWSADLLESGEKTLQRFPVGAPARGDAGACGSPDGGAGAGTPCMIGPGHARAGVGLIQKRAKRLYEDAALLYGRGRFQNAIVLAILSIEESLKGEYVASKAQKSLGITAKQWDRLEIHGYKLGSIDSLEGMLEDDDVKEFYRLRMARRAIPAFGTKKPTKDDIKSFRVRMRGLRLGLDFVKKRCLYDEWSPQYGRWDEFAYLERAVQDDLAFCLMDMARWQFAAFGLAAGCPLAESGEKPRWPALGGDHDEPHKLLSGEIVLDAMLQEQLAAMCPQAVTRNIAKRCMEMAYYSYHDDINWHPVVKAFFVAYGSLLQSPDGEYEVEADNAEQTYEGRPTMRVRVRMRKEGLVGECKAIVVNGVEYRAHDSRIDALLGAEEALTGMHGSEAPADMLVKAFAGIGVGVYMLRDEEVGDAIREARAAVEAGAPMPGEMAAGIRTATREGWDGLSPDIRAYVAAAYKRKANAMVLSRTVGTMRKSMIRDMVWNALTEWNAARRGRPGNASGANAAPARP